MKIIIVGAGIGGIAAARAIHKACPEAQICVYEKNEANSVQGHALLLTPNGGLALKSLGLESAILSKSKIVSASRSFDSQNYLTQQKNVKALGDELGFPFLAMSRWDLHRVLLSGLDNVMFHYGMECLGVSEENEKVLVSFSHNEVVEADVVIIADGAASTLRQQLFPDARIIPANIISARGLVDSNSFQSDKLADATSYFYREQGKYFVTLSLPNGYRYWNAMLTVDKLRRHLKYSEIKDMFSSWPEPVKSLMRCVSEKNVIIRPLCDLAPMSTWTKGRVALLGDAAHAVLPTLGQGANQALMDAVTIADSIKKYYKDEDITKALSEYEKERLPTANCAIRESREHTLGIFKGVKLVDTHSAQQRIHRSIPCYSETRKKGPKTPGSDVDLESEHGPKKLCSKL